MFVLSIALPLALAFEASDEPRRHLSARINGGGAPVRASTTNGAIRIGAP
jgi:hypothetical protein